MENATSFSSPSTKVSVLGKRRSDGYLIVIVDEGFGMPREELDQCNRRLSEPASFDSSPTKVLGLHVVGKLAQRHGIRAELTESFSVGTAARVLLPDSMFDSAALGSRGTAPALVSAPALGLAVSGPRNEAPAYAAPVGHVAVSSVGVEGGDDFDALFDVPFGTTGPLDPLSTAGLEATRRDQTSAVETSAVETGEGRAFSRLARRPPLFVPTSHIDASPPETITNTASSETVATETVATETDGEDEVIAATSAEQAATEQDVTERDPAVERNGADQVSAPSPSLQPSGQDPVDADDWLSDAALASATGPLLAHPTAEPSVVGPGSEVDAAIAADSVPGRAEATAAPTAGLRRRVPGAGRSPCLA